MPWKRTEVPDFANHCHRICERYGVDYYGYFDTVRDSIQENIALDPIEGSVAVDEADPEIRRFIYEPVPQDGSLPALVVIFKVETDDQSFTLLEVWTEEELDEQT